MADEPMFRVNGKDYPVPTDLTLGEMCDAERYFGVEFGSRETSGMRMASALLWIAVSRAEANVTVDDIRNLPADVFAAVEEEVLPPDSGSSGNGSSEPSGDSSSPASAVPDNGLAPIGHPV